MEIYCGDQLAWNQVKSAATPFRRFMGLMGRRSLAPGEGLLITPCKQVHGFNMRFTLDILFLSDQMQVVSVFSLKPGRISPWVRDAHCVLEVEAGSAGKYGIRAGDRLALHHNSKMAIDK